MSSKLIGLLLILAVAALVPLGLIALSRSRPSSARMVHPVLDMDKQPRFKGQRPNAMFADGRAMRPAIPGTVAREDMMDPADATGSTLRPFADPAAYDRILHGVELRADGKRADGKQAGGKMVYVNQIPVPVNLDLMRRGQERYNVYCSGCHGLSGYGDGMVARRAVELQAGGNAPEWTSPSSYHSGEVPDRPVGHIFNTITNGIRSMPAHGAQIPPQDRWAIVAYVKALQRSQNARPQDIPEADRGKLSSGLSVQGAGRIAGPVPTAEPSRTPKSEP